MIFEPRAADLDPTDVEIGEGLWAHIAWPDLDAAVRIGTITGGSSDHPVLRAAAGIADGHPVDLGALAAGLDTY